MANQPTLGLHIEPWLDLIAPDSKSLSLQNVTIIGRDHAPPIWTGDAEIDIRDPGRFAYRFEGNADDGVYAMQMISHARRHPYDALARFRLIGEDQQGRQWNAGYTFPDRIDELDGRWFLEGRCDGLMGGDSSNDTIQTCGVEAVFLIPPELALGRVMDWDATRIAMTKNLTVGDHQIAFRYDPKLNRLFAGVNCSPSLSHPFLSGVLAEPFRILFGQLLFPRLVIRTYDGGYSHVHLGRSPPLTRTSGFVALWPYNDDQTEKGEFWDLYSRLFQISAREGGAHPSGLTAHTITSLYEEVIQATSGTHWVLALTLASACEALLSRLATTLPPIPEESAADADALAKYIQDWKGPQSLRDAATRAVMRSKDTTTAKTLRKLAERGDVTKAQASAWTSMRNQVMHGKLVLPWSDMKQDEKIQELAGLFHSLTRAVAREG